MAAAWVTLRGWLFNGGARLDRQRVMALLSPVLMVFMAYVSAQGTGGFNDSRVQPDASGASLMRAYSIGGTVFEDIHYGGGRGRTRSAASGVGMAGATVEIFDSATSARLASTSTAADGSYVFSNITSNHTFVRVVQSSVRSTRSGSTASVVGVQTWRFEASFSAPAAVSNEVGGLDPAAATADPAAGAASVTWTTCATENGACRFTGTRLVRYGANSTFTTRVLTGGTTCSNGVFGDPIVGTPKRCQTLDSTLHSVSSVFGPPAGGGNVGGLDFGFNFSTVVNTRDSGPGSLRQAILNANTLTGEAGLVQQYRAAGTEHIVFMLPNGSTGAGGSLNLPAGGLRAALNAFATPGFAGNVATLAPQSPLPALSAGLVLDAQAQPGWTAHPLVEINSAAAAGSALTGNGANLVRGLILNRSRLNGLDFSGSGSAAEGNWIGLNALGTGAAANAQDGIALVGTGHRVGGSTAAQRNVISGNTRFGVDDVASARAAGNHVITGNWVGLNAAGTGAVGNGSGGLVLDEATGTRIGGTAAGEGNVVSGNSGDGITAGAVGLVVQGNRVGTNPAGAAALPNTGVGINILVRSSGAANVTIGGTAAGSANLVAGNAGSGIVIAGGNAGRGAGLVVAGNLVGVHADGASALANGGHGIHVIQGATGVTIGGNGVGAGNLISGNALAGVRIEGSSNVVAGNTIGLAADGSTVLRNGPAGWASASASTGAGMGVQVASGRDNRIGGLLAAERNVISGHAWAGVLIETGNNGTLVQGNHIGTDATGQLARGNGVYGIELRGAVGATTIGGAAAGASNVVSGNGLGGRDGNGGVALDGDGHVLHGNRIGVAADRSTVLGNGMVVSGRPGNAIWQGRGRNVRIGGVGAGEGNHIAGSPGAGVLVTDHLGASRGTAIRGNRIDNTGIGIDLRQANPTSPDYEGSSPNDGLRTSTPNSGMDTPVFSSASLSGNTLTVAGWVGSAPGQSAFSNDDVDVYLSTGHSSGFGSGSAYIGTLATDANGNFQGNLTVPAGVALVTGSSRVTATATDGADNTSEFSPNVTLLDRYTVTTTQDGADTLVGSLRWALRNANADAGVQTVRFNIPASDPNLASGVWTITPASALPPVTEATLIDARTQPGYVGVPLVQLRGAAAGPGSHGVQLTTAAGSTLRGLVINGFGGCAVRLDGPGGHTVAGNYIGTDISGSAPATGNGALGVCVNSPRNTVGGTGADDRNVVGGFLQAGATEGRGVDITAGAASNSVTGNWIGAGADGVTPVPNQHGVVITDASSNTLGGSTGTARNIISGNQRAGVSVRTQSGSASANVIAGNRIGTNPAGTAAMANGSHGVFLQGGSATVVGGSAAGAGNLIGGNGGHGVSQNGAGATGTVLRGNWIGLNAAGASAVANALGGVDAALGGGMTVGGAGANDGNLISGHSGGPGLLLQVTGNVVQGNGFGLNAAGTGALGNDSGVRITANGSNTIGGAAPGERNVISGNTRGIQLRGGSGAMVRGNWVGLNAAGTGAVGNTVDGVAFELNATGHTLGGSAAGEGNVISGNGRFGVSFDAAGGNTVQGNLIGRNPDNTAHIGNTSDGVHIAAGAAMAKNNVIGGLAAGQGNVIAGNGRSGITVSGHTTGNALRGNAVYGNTLVGIDLATSVNFSSNGTTANDGAKTPGQPQLLMDSPVLTRAVLGSNTAAVVGYVGTAALQATFGAALVDVYVSNAGQGQTYLGTVTANADGEFAGVFSTASVSGLVAGSTQLVATATDAGGNTSEFGNAVSTVALAALSNSSFETGANPGGFTTYNTGNSGNVSGWTVTGRSIDHIGTAWTAANGVRSLDLSGTGRGGVVQVVQTVPGQTYTLTLSVAANAGCGSATKLLRVTAANASQSFTLTNAVPAWLDRSLVFTATSEATALWFESLEVSACGPTLDNVRLNLGNSSIANISGTVFEDRNYGGGAGRARANAPGNSPRPNARVELFDASGNLVTSTTSNPSGAYSFTNLALGRYSVRVVSASVSSSRAGYTSSLVPTATYRADATGGTAIADLAFVGGSNPLLNDAGNAGTTLAALTTPSAKAQAVAAVQLAGALTGLDFGFSFNLVTHTGDSGSGSLRQAIANANALGDDSTLLQSGRSSGNEHIVFMLPNGTGAAGLRSAFNAFTTNAGAYNVATLRLASALPWVSTPMVLDAQTQPGWTLAPLIEIDASAVTAWSAGLNLRGGSSTVRGFVLNRLPGPGIELTGSNYIVQGNYVGLDASGSSRHARGAMGIGLSGSGSNVLIGGATPAQRNVIVTVQDEAIAVGSWTADPTPIGGYTAVIIQGNYIGTNAAGTAALGVTGTGIIVRKGSDGAVVGGAAAGQGNVIAASVVGLIADGDNAVIRGNAVGTNASASAALPNATGVMVRGNGALLTGNVVSGNTGSGVELGGSAATLQGNTVGSGASGTAALPNGGNGVRVVAGAGAQTIGGPGAGNLISGNAAAGVAVEAATAAGTVIQGNTIGLNAAGTAALPNSGVAGVVLLSGATGVTVGGAAAGAGNVISGNAQQGVLLQATAGAGNALLGNLIGTSAAGTAALANAQNGVLVQAAGTAIGGVAAGSRNVISGNGQGGVRIEANSTRVQGNHIGINATGTAALGNGANNAAQGGVWVISGSGTVIGGTAAGAGNVISGNGGAGLWVDNGSGTVQGNFIGTNAAGTAALGNRRWGITLGSLAGPWLIGGAAAGAGNVVSGNVGSDTGGISSRSNNLTVQGNTIGLNTARTAALPNGGGGTLVDAGIDIRAGTGVLIGGLNPGEGNVIARNAGKGVQLAGASTQAAILGNSIVGNTGLGIDLITSTEGGNVVTANDGAKSTAEPNDLMDHPVFTAAALSGDQLFVSGHVGSAANQSTFANSRVEVFVAESPADARGHGEGQTYLGFITTDANGNFSGRLTVAPTVTIDPGTSRVTSTATDAAGHTSEFGPNATVTAGVAGRVFEDVNYGGGAGRSWTAASANGAQPRPGARVEIGSISGSVVTVFAHTTTAADGSYVLPTLGAGSYAVRVVGETVTSSRSGASSTLRATPTFVAHAPFGTRVEYTSFVGGLNPAASDAGPAAPGASFNTSDGVFTAGATGTANALGLVQLGGSASMGDIDFGFNFTTVVNTNDVGAGSLRQVLTHANTLGGDAALVVAGRAPGIEHVVFMVGNGSSAPGLRSTVNLFSGATALIAPTTGLPYLDAPVVIDARQQPGFASNGDRPVVVVDGQQQLSHIFGFSAGASGSSLRGLAVRGSALHGVDIAGGSGVLIEGNHIGNLGPDGNVAGTGRHNLNGVVVRGSGHTVRSNVVSGNPNQGIFLGGAGGHVVEGNLVGLNASGTSTIASGNGITVEDSPNNTVGGSSPAQRNVVGGNVRGVIILGTASTGNQVLGNHIGVAADGSTAVPNQQGVVVQGSASGNTIGGSTEAARNLISGNTAEGVALVSGGQTLIGNWIGLSASGGALGNQVGVSTEGAGNRIGGASAGEGNVIGGNRSHGVVVSGALTAGTLLRGNRMGVNDAATTTRPNGGAGILLANGATGVTVGGSSAAAANVIGGNALQGVRFESGATGVTVQGNFIGTDASGARDLGNTLAGVGLGVTSGNLVGGTTTAEANVVAFNKAFGVGVNGGSNNRILGNRIYSNSSIGIDLLADGVTANDGVKSGSATQASMDHPVFTGARARGNQLSVAGYVGSAAGQSAFANARVEIFESDSDASGFGEGRSYMGFVTTDADGNFDGNVTLPVGALRIGTRLTATATDAAGNTSEFGATFANLRVDNLVNDHGDAADASPGDGLCETATPGQCTLRAAIMEFNAFAAQGSTPTVAFALPGCSAAGQAACRISPASGLPAALRPMRVDAQTQPGWVQAPIVSLEGSSAGAGVSGLTVEGANSAVLGFIVHGFRGAGLQVASTATGTRVAGNWVGLDASGSAAANLTGIQVSAASVTLGGATAAERNLIAGNGDNGVDLRVGATAAVVQGNWFGLAPDGVSVRPSAKHGIRSGAGVTATIGGGLAGQGNVFAGHGLDGLSLDGGSGTVHGNTFGLGADGSTPRPLNRHGVHIMSGAWVIGGTGPGEANTIVGNGVAGILVNDGAKATISGNQIRGNGSLGIDLGHAGAPSSGVGTGITVNDGSTNAGQANNGMDHPALSGAGVNTTGTALTISGFIGTGSGQAAFAGSRVEFFKAAPDATGHGEGEVYLGFLVADGSGRFSGTISFPAGLLAVGDPVTATATDNAGHTSEFGPNWTTTTLAAMAPAGFNAFEIDTPLLATNGVLRTRVGGVTGSVAVVALDSNGTGLHAGLTGTVALEWLDARNDSGAAAGSCRASWMPLGSAGNVSFIRQARVTVVLTPPATATRAMRLRMTYNGPAGTVTSCSGDAFAVRPASLVLAASDADAASPGLARALANAAASGGVVHRAGRPFTLTVRALDAAGSVMTGYDGTPAVTVGACLLPAGCTAGAFNAGSLTATAGVATANDALYGEVGVIALTGTDDSYADIDAADTLATLRQLQSAAATVGRFVPDSLVAEVATPGVLTTGNTSCMASGAAATFYGQGFGWQTAPQVLVTARNAQGGTTRHWRGALMKLAGTTGLVPALSASNATGATLGSTYGALSVGDLGDGQARINASTTDLFLLQVTGGGALGERTPTWQYSLDLTDSAEAGVAGNPTLTATATQLPVAFSAGARFVSGRLSLTSAHGDARIGVRMLLQLQRYSDSGWVTMTEDRGCVTVGPQHLALSSPVGIFQTAGLCAAPVAGAVTTGGGRAWLAFAPTPAGAPGRLLAQVASASLPGNACGLGGLVQPALPLAQAWLTQSSGPQALAIWGVPRRDAVLRREFW